MNGYGAKEREFVAGRILVVDDDDAVRGFVEGMLAIEGYGVSGVPDPLEAIELVEQGNEYDLLLTDVTMPNLNGAELARRICARSSRIKVVFMSGEAEGAHTSYAGPAAFLQKPFAYDQLLFAVRESLLSG